MAKPKRTNIPWVDWTGGCANFVIRGQNCPTSPGCAHCYVARDFAQRGRAMSFHTAFYPEKLAELARVNLTDDGGMPFRRGLGSRPIVFPCDYGDIGHPDLADEQVRAAFRVMGEREDADWVVLTKRIARFAEDCRAVTGFARLPRHIWLGTSVEDTYVLRRLDYLWNVPMDGVRVVSFAPLLENIVTLTSRYYPAWKFVGWSIVEGESGPDRRPYDHQWGRNLLELCRYNGIPFFLKQGSATRPGGDNLLDGQVYHEFPR